MTRGSIGAAALTASAFFFLGCSTATIDPTDEDAGDPGAAPSAFVAADLGPGDNPASGCGFAEGTWLAIGATNSPVADGLTNPDESGGTVAVSCVVQPRADGAFDVNVSAALTGGGDASGSFTVRGRFTGDGEQTGVAATLQKGGMGSFRQEDCAVAYEPPLQGIAAGRVWGTLTCAKATYEAQNKVCRAKVEFKFESCATSP